MKRHLMSLVLACALILSALPLMAMSSAYARSMPIAMVITSTQVHGWKYGSAQEITLRFFADQDFDTSTGEIIKAGNSKTGLGFYRSYVCSISGSTLTIPTITDLPTTTDSPSAPASTWTSRFYQGNTARDYWIPGFFIKHTVSSPQVWSDVFAYNHPPGFQPHPNAITYDQAALLISQSLGTLNYANVSSAGRIETSVTPVDSSHPIAVGDNDPRVPAQAENDALVGTSGTPSSSNKYATDAEPRLNEDYNASGFASLTAAVAAVPSGGGTLVVSTSMAATSVSIPSYVHLKLTGKAQLTGSGTVTIAGDFEAPKNKRVFASGLTVSFSGNKTLTTVYPEWWGASAGGAAATNSTAFQATSDALCTNTASGFASGLIQFGPGVYNFNAAWYIGVNNVAGIFTGISLKGTNGLVGTNLQWTGSTSGTAIQFGRSRRPRIDDLYLTNGVAKGTTIGIIFSGANSNMQTSGPLLTSVGISGFHYGIQEGGIPGNLGASQAAEFTTLLNCFLTANDYGYIGAGSGNSVGIIFENVYCTLNTTFGLYIGAGTSTTHISSGIFTGNGTAGNLATGDIGVNLDWNRTVAIEKTRFEVGNGTTDTHIGGIVNLGNIGAVSLRNSVIQASAVPNVPFVRGVYYLTVESSTFGGDAEDGWIVANADGMRTGDWIFTQNQIQNTNTRTVPGGGNNTVALGIQFDPSNSGSQGLKIRGKGNYYASGGAVTKFDDVDAIIGAVPAATGKVYATRRVNAFGEVSSDAYLWTTQDATPSVKWATLFQTQNSAGTTYTNFLNGVEGQTISIFVNDANTVFKNNSTMVTRTAADVTATNGFTYSWTFIGAKWRQN